MGQRRPGLITNQIHIIQHPDHATPTARGDHGPGYSSRSGHRLPASWRGSQAAGLRQPPAWKSALTPGNLLAFGGSAEVAGASGAPLQCGMLSIAPSALERIATALGVKSHPPREGEFRVVSVVD